MARAKSPLELLWERRDHARLRAAAVQREIDDLNRQIEQHEAAAADRTAPVDDSRPTDPAEVPARVAELRRQMRGDDMDPIPTARTAPTEGTVATCEVPSREGVGGAR